MKALCINCSDNQAQVCLINDEKKSIYQVSSPHSENLMPFLDQLFDAENISVSDFDYFSAVVGPGSFTGIRIAVATIKAMACVNKKANIVSITNFDLIASNIKTNGEYLIVLDSGNIDAFYAKYDGLKCLEIGYKDKNTVGDFAKQNDLLVFADKKQFEGLSVINANFIDLDENTLLNSFENKIDSQDFININDLKPQYIKLSQAERTRSEKILNDLSIKEVNDENELIGIEKECFKDDYWNEQTFKSEIDAKDKYYFVACYDNINIGYIGFEKTFDEANIQKVAVLQDYRNCSVGKKLVEFALEKMKELGVQTVFLEVDENNLDAIKLYKKFGFEVFLKRENYYKNGNACLNMKMQLK